MFGVIYSSRSTKKVNDALMKSQMDNISAQIKALEAKQDKHNSIIERTYELEKSDAEIRRDVKTIYNNMDDMKEDIRGVRTEVDNISKTVNEVKESEIRLEGKVEKE